MNVELYPIRRAQGVCGCVLGPGPHGCSACGAPPLPDAWRYPQPAPTITTTSTTTNVTIKVFTQKPDGEAMRAEDV